MIYGTYLMSFIFARRTVRQPVFSVGANAVE